MIDNRMKLQDIIKSDHIVVFSKTTCPYCKKTKSILDRLQAKYTVYEIDKRNDQELILRNLLIITGGNTVPRVFVDGKFIGGHSEIQRLHEERKLERMLKIKWRDKANTNKNTSVIVEQMYSKTTNGLNSSHVKLFKNTKNKNGV